MYGNDGERPVRLNGGASTSPVAPSSAFLGVSAAAERVRERIRAAAPLRAPVLITGGERGRKGTGHPRDPLPFALRSGGVPDAQLRENAGWLALLSHVRRVFIWSRHPDLNWGPADYESAALPTELCRHRDESDGHF
jgi:hypothetical protein